MPTCVSYMVSSMEEVNLLFWNAGSLFHIAEFHNAYIWNRKQNSEVIWSLPTRKYRTWTKMAWRRRYPDTVKWTPGTCVRRISRMAEEFWPWWFLSASPISSTTCFTKISREWYMIFASFNQGCNLPHIMFVDFPGMVLTERLICTPGLRKIHTR